MRCQETTRGGSTSTTSSSRGSAAAALWPLSITVSPLTELAQSSTADGPLAGATEKSAGVRMSTLWGMGQAKCTAHTVLVFYGVTLGG
jgi:hypothetical protein